MSYNAAGAVTAIQPVPTPMSPAPLFNFSLPTLCPSLACIQNDATCAALSDFYCATNGWLWAQGAQGAEVCGRITEGGVASCQA